MIQLLIATLQIAGIILGYLRDKKLIDAGVAKQIKENLDASNALIKKANAARDAAGADFDQHGLHDNDPNLRD